MRYRVTIRGEGTELRGYATPEALAELADIHTDTAVVVASPVDDTYNPFEEPKPLAGTPETLVVAPCQSIEAHPGHRHLVPEPSWCDGLHWPPEDHS
jgi:hypothetical protein